MGVAFLVSVYVIRYLGPEQYGLLSYSLTFVQLFMPLVGLGLGGILVRDIVKNPEEEKVLLSSAFFLKLSLGLAAYLAILLYLGFSNSADLEKYSIAILGLMLLFNAILVLESYLIAKVKAKSKSLSKITTITVISIAKLMMVYFEMPLLYFVSALVFENALYLAILILVYLKNSSFSLRPKLGRMKDLARNGWPFILADYSMFFLKKIDILIVTYFISLSVAGYYSVASKLTGLLIAVPMVILSSIFPLLIKKDTEQNLNQSLVALYRIMIFSLFPIVVIISLFSEQIILLIFGQTFAPSGELFAIYAWVSIFMTIHMISNKWFLIKNLQKEFFYRALIAGIINIVLSVVLTKAYGVTGAAFGTLFAMFLLAYVSLFFSKNGRDLRKLIEKSLFLRRTI